ncbi:peptidoglycan DD-metalloendopeptidase family protein [Campylobacter insulaenigrae]|uniref:Peptidoglycan DD-metalloendopeptidase family protein n=1 Tax=Campylobacter insulaenigrae TaxID=260714 RepID=A0ABY3G3T5_9BACT|nr:M23 family metallopeptidase [Campylobacter insulaenigrae]MCR6570242.1 peptidoglycan DD-metalloendopeptidase family protein [Campylobacter insulaenigrae]MCR6572027.1 peptidoglycan DD-metalloendopeptidase family protein [Campylobacter insulaenigrae]MCR6573285.1 peptidoglycan DD-metalloendopeptidase family protein [Campylobacter insulaenigrae]MCR6575853.1 peptidoglycan DD-metalloendopeptidase family protein [Campylobacter insulaenigrae]MCR6576246.1 peptidoglycan DD-metalloendopeptidase family 
MKKYIFLFFFVFLLAHSDEIAQKQKDIKENERIVKQLSKKLEDLAGEILDNEKNLKKIASEINLLNGKTLKLENSVKTQIKALEQLNNQNKDLLKNKNQIEGKLIDLIAKDFAYDLAIPQNYIESEDGIIALEIIGNLDKIFNEEFLKISKDYEDINKKIEDKENQIAVINTSLKEYKNQIDELRNLRKKQEVEIAKQKTDKEIYTRKLSSLQVQQQELRKTLNQLKIIQEKQEEKVAQKQEDNKEKNNIKQIGSSFQTSNVKRYVGAKTISPLESYTVKQQFGNYVDPIYNIKIYNENVVLKSTNPDAAVRNVLDGKIVFAKATPTLKKVVIVENKEGIHTIYAHLDKIAPGVKVGRNIKKGYIIGRVESDLTFEVTQKNYHINPLEMIR